MAFLRRLAQHLHLSDTKQLIAQNLFWAVIGKVVTLASGLFVGIVIARYLGPEQYGLMNYVISYVFLFQTFAIFGLDAIEVREEARAKEPYQKIIGTAFGIKVLSGIVFIALVIVTSILTESDSYTSLLIAIYAFSIVINSLSVVRNYFMAIMQNEYVVKSEIVRTVIGIAVKLTLVLVHAPLLWIVVAYVFDGVLLSSGYLLAYRTKVGSVRQWRFDGHYARFLVKESFPLLITSAAVIIYQRIDQLMIGQIISKESVGYFSVASRFVEILLFIPMMLSQTITPVLVKAYERDYKEYAVKSQQFMNMSVWLSLLAALVVSLCAYWLVRLTFGMSYLPAIAVLQVMAFKAASVALSSTAGAMLVTEGLQRYAFLRDGLGCVVCIVLNYLFLPRYGIMAAAVVAIISNVAAGYLADALIPAYPHIFVRQSKALTMGWKSIFSLKKIFIIPQQQRQ